MLEQSEYWMLLGFGSVFCVKNLTSEPNTTPAIIQPFKKLMTLSLATSIVGLTKNI